MFKTIQPFIDAGWNTVPLQGELRRLADEKKTIPSFEKDWLHKYTKSKNTNATAIGAAITGSTSGIIAIDCDNATTYDMFRAIDAHYLAIFESIGKGGGTIIYSYTEIAPESFRLVTKNASTSDTEIKLDFYNGTGCVYLPTEDNKTKKTWVEMPTIKNPPESVLLLINTLYQHSKLGSGSVVKNCEESRHNFNLAPMLSVFVQQKEFQPDLFKILTPHSFRSIPQYVEEGFLHPSYVPDGRGSEYLVAISAILGADESVDEELYVSSMLLINTLWDKPMPGGRFDSTIIHPMLDNKSSINGKIIWRYNKNWLREGFYIENKKHEMLEVFYDDHTSLYYVINQNTGKFMFYERLGDCFSYLDVVSLTQVKVKSLVRKVPLITASVQPHLISGMYYIETNNGTKKAFNLFRQSRAINIINNPEQWKSSYEYPNNTINFLKSLVPDETTLAYLLSFLRTKFTTFTYSPVILYFLGISGSGKDTFVELINRIMGEEYDYIAKPSAKMFLEKHNGWLRNIFFAQLDEYGDQLMSISAKREVTGRIKMYTGSPIIQMRKMHSDGENMRHVITFIMTANTNPLTLDDNDRRIMFINTPNILKNEEWVVNSGGISNMRDKMKAELFDFCFYLATKITSLAQNEYVTPPDNPEKLGLIASSLPPADKLIFCLQYALIDELMDIIVISGINPFKTCQPDGIHESTLYEILSEYDPDSSSRKILSLALKKSNIEKKRTTYNGIKDHYCLIDIPQELREPIKFKDKPWVGYSSAENEAGSLPDLEELNDNGNQ